MRFLIDLVIACVIVTSILSIHFVAWKHYKSFRHPTNIVLVEHESWHTNWQDAFEQGKEENKWIVLMFTAEWCPPCKRMKQEILPHNDIETILSSYISSFVDVDNENNNTVKNKYLDSKQGIPQFVIINPHSRKIYNRTIGYQSVAKFSRFLQGKK